MAGIKEYKKQGEGYRKKGGTVGKRMLEMGLLYTIKREAGNTFRQKSGEHTTMTQAMRALMFPRIFRIHDVVTT